ncbi:2-succinyl-5-enolpyruvyl-6-hydroxy-3-cyclohexene-1-carboxylate synthase [Faecalicatena contorta]|uniref:thiamine pyrophosphate-binding protein n=1 Tax=Faecalicatena contorta TaxID=39482 RepID=UPI00129EC385|nr:thiamine pyrophosphate-binding protein [Faecalicatena contorta]MRM91200.1 2-succinyl-5-enolpyruvyl-6-hydroxy-3-cyclohexene-1-carboxylate synthase [Faecalicatena contorta]
MYTDERNAQILISLLKQNNIKKVIASPGTTNACLVASLQGDSFFEVYSAPEERVGAYMACGMAAECGEPVVLSCTGATASRNYMPALTEAYYRKLPILAITSSRRNAYIGHNCDQVTDRTCLPNDVVNLSVQMPVVLDHISEWNCGINANKAIQELFRNGGGPVHINIETQYSQECVSELIDARKIIRYGYNDTLPSLKDKKIAIMVGNHEKWSVKLTEAVDNFCATYDSVVLCDHTSNYHGKYRIFATLTSNQSYWKPSYNDVDVLIHIGHVSSSDFNINSKEVWRINPDGEIRDTYQKLKKVFQMDELYFFNYYAEIDEDRHALYDKCACEFEQVSRLIPELPFSNLWIASVTSKRLPKDSSLHLGIRNTLRTWNYYDVDSSINGFSNTGGFGIDGIVSSAVGAALVNPNSLVFCVLGDLAFFYDISVLGNRHLPKNLRIILVNNGVGLEMRGGFTLGHKIASSLKVDESVYIAAGGHYRYNSEIVKHLAEDNGIGYLQAENKNEYLEQVERFINSSSDKSIIFEVFVAVEDEEKAILSIGNLLGDKNKGAKTLVKNVIGEDNFKSLKKLIKGK